MLHVRGDGTIGFCKCRMIRRHQGIISENVASRNRTDSGMIAPPVMDGGIGWVITAGLISTPEEN